MPGVSSYEAIVSTVRFLERFKGGAALKGEALKLEKQKLLDVASEALDVKQLQRAKYNLKNFDSFERAIHSAGTTFNFNGNLVNDLKGFNTLSKTEQAFAIDKLKRLSEEGDRGAKLFLQEVLNAPKWRAMARNHR